MDSIEHRLNGLPEFLRPLRLACDRHMARRAEVSKSGVVSIGHRPWVAPSNYMIVLYPGIAKSAIQRYAETFAICVPDYYASFMQSVGGAFCFGMSLFGIPPSMLASPPFFDRTVLQCHDLATAAKEWVTRYRVVKESFHFGSRHFSRCENIGYFFDENNCIYSARTSGQVVARWSSFTAFLSDELEASERLDDELYNAPS